MQLSHKDVADIDRANQETCKYFAYICQFMIIYILYSVVRMALDSARAFDLIDIFLTFSYLIMLFGVSISIKTSVDKAVRESRLQNEINIFEEVQVTTDDSEDFNTSLRDPRDPLIKNKLKVNNS
jgi:hypothetical protein